MVKKRKVAPFYVSLVETVVVNCMEEVFKTPMNDSARAEVIRVIPVKR